MSKSTNVINIKFIPSDARVILEKVKELVCTETYEAILKRLEDYSLDLILEGLKIVKKPLGDYREGDDEEFDFWKVLKGEWVKQHCGILDDEFYGYITLKLNKNQYLQVSYYI